MKAPTIAIGGALGAGKDTAADILVDEYGYTRVSMADELKRFCVEAFWLSPDGFWGPSEQRNQPLTTPIDAHHLNEACRHLNALVNYPILASLFLPSISRERALAELRATLTPLLPITTPRRLLQYVGTDWARRLDPDVWVRPVHRAIRAIGNGMPYFPQDGIIEKMRTRVRPSAAVIPDCRFRNEALMTRADFNGLVFWVDASRRVPTKAEFAHASEAGLKELGDYVTNTIDNNGLPEDLFPQIKAIVGR